MKRNWKLMGAAILLALALLAGCGMSKEQVQKEVAKLCQEKILDTDAEYQRLRCKVDSVILVKTAVNENKYEGEVEVSSFTGQYSLKVSVIADKNAVRLTVTPDGIRVLREALKKADAIKEDTETKTAAALQNQLNADAKYGGLGATVKNVQLAEAGDTGYQGYALVNAHKKDYKLDIAVTTGDGDVQYELSPEAVSTLDGVVQWQNDILAQGYAAYLGTWVLDTKTYYYWYIISSGEMQRSNSYNIITYNDLQWRLVNDNTNDRDYNQFGYQLYNAQMSGPYIYLHKTDSTKLSVSVAGWGSGQYIRD